MIGVPLEGSCKGSSKGSCEGPPEGSTGRFMGSYK